MNALSDPPAPAQAPAPSRPAAIWLLLLLSPIFSELLSGSTRVTTILVLIPSTGVWGCAALLIREVARRRGGRWTILLLGLALAVAEECIIQQTSLAPLIGIKPEHAYARAFGVNWVYFLWALGFESIWAVVVPVALTEIVFPERRHEPWLRRRGIIIAGVVLAMSSFVAWFAWTQVFLPKFFPQSAYHPPLAAFAVALAAIAALVAAALLLGRRAAMPAPPPASEPPRPASLVVFALVSALPWYLLILLAFGARPHWPVAVPLLGGMALALVVFAALRRWSGRPGWNDSHRLALVSGVAIATLIGGSIALAAGKALPVDRIGQIVFNLAALGWPMTLARKRVARSAPE